MKILLYFLLAIILFGCSSIPVVEQPPGPPNLGVIGGFNAKPWDIFLSLSPVNDPDATTEDRMHANKEIYKFLSTLWSNFVISPNTLNLWDEIVKSMSTLSVRLLYELGLPDSYNPQKKSWRSFVFQAGRIKNKFIFEVQGKDKGKVSQKEKYTFSRFGQFRGAAFLKPIPENESLYSFRLGVEMDIGGISWDGVIGSISKFIKMYDISNIKPSNISQKLENTVRKSYPKLAGDSILFMSKMIRAAPHVTSIFPRYIIVENILDTNSSENFHWTDIHLRLKFNMPYLDYYYPAFATFIKKKMTVINAKFILRDSLDNQVITVKLNKSGLHIDTSFSQGKIIPRDSDGQMLFDQAIDVQSNIGKFYWDGRLILNLSGIKLRFEDIKVRCSYQKLPDHGSFKVRFYEIPKLIVEGSLWGFIPVWVVDVLIPSNIEDLAMKFFETLTQCNNGEGVKMSIAHTSGAMQKRFVFHSALELEDSGFFGFIMRLFYSRFLPSQEERSQATEILFSLLNASWKDFSLLARYYRIKNWKQSFLDKDK